LDRSAVARAPPWQWNTAPARSPGSVLFWRVRSGVGCRQTLVDRPISPTIERGRRAVASSRSPIHLRPRNAVRRAAVRPSASARASRRRRPPYLLTYLPTEDSLGRTKTRSQLRTWSSGVGPKRTGSRVRSVFSAAHRREIHNCSALHCIAV